MPTNARDKFYVPNALNALSWWKLLSQEPKQVAKLAESNIAHTQRLPSVCVMWANGKMALMHQNLYSLDMRYANAAYIMWQQQQQCLPRGSWHHHVGLSISQSPIRQSAIACAIKFQRAKWAKHGLSANGSHWITLTPINRSQPTAPHSDPFAPSCLPHPVHPATNDVKPIRVAAARYSIILTTKTIKLSIVQSVCAAHPTNVSS